MLHLRGYGMFSSLTRSTGNQAGTFKVYADGAIQIAFAGVMSFSAFFACGVFGSSCFSRVSIALAFEALGSRASFYSLYESDKRICLPTCLKHLNRLLLFSVPYDSLVG